MAWINCKNCNKKVFVKNRYTYCSVKCRYESRRKETIVGQRNGSLTIIKEVKSIVRTLKSGKVQKKRMVLCQCDCGNTTITQIARFKNGGVKSCGCLKKSILMERAKKRIIPLPFYHKLKNVWRHIIDRCYNVNDYSYSIYGGRGVRVCEEWLNDFMSFYKWAIENNWRPELQIDKDIIGNGLLYSPATCKIVTSKENGYHKRTNRYIEYCGEYISIAELADIAKLPYGTVRHRISNRKMSAIEAISKPIKEHEHFFKK